MKKLVSTYRLFCLPKPVPPVGVVFETDKRWYVADTTGPGKVYCHIEQEGVEGSDVIRVWIDKQGLAHRTNGPSIESTSGYKMWTVRGCQMYTYPAREYPPPEGG
jgi:hypothetical protein